MTGSQPLQDFLPFARKALTMFYGYPDFRPGQDRVVNAILNNRDVIAVMPTGAGKSVCYQLPATRPGSLTIVVTPLRALMRDQVQALLARNIPAALIDSGVSVDERDRIYREAGEGRLRLLYVAPERLFTTDFHQFTQTTPIQLIAVDEAHCVLQWGHDFRSSYLHIGEFITGLPQRPVVAAFTATATPQQIPEICMNLHLYDPIQVRTGFDRSNIRFRVLEMKPSERSGYIARYAASHTGAGVVYCNSRKECDVMATLLRRQGVNAEAFYATLPDDRKADIQDQFLHNQIQAICATTAFGMGVDKPNIRWVVNDGACDSLEGFYQEAGRGGRDGLPAESLLIWTPGDFVQMRHRIRTTAGSTVSDPQAKQAAVHAAYERLSGMDMYCHAAETGVCLRRTLLDYFGDNAPESCGNCSVCLGETPSSQGDAPYRGRGSVSTMPVVDTPVFDANPSENAPEPVEKPSKPKKKSSKAPLATQPATPEDRQRMQAFIDFVNAEVRLVGHGFGQSKTISLLQGDASKAEDTGLDQLPEFGKLAGVEYTEMRRLLESLTQNGNLQYGKFTTIMPGEVEELPEEVVTRDAIEQHIAENKAKREARAKREAAKAAEE